MLFMSSSFSSTYVSSSSSSESSSSSSFMDTKKESTLVFSVTEKSIESTSSLRELIDAKESERSSPLAAFINAYLINAAFKPLEVISLLSDDVR